MKDINKIFKILFFIILIILIVLVTFKKDRSVNLEDIPPADITVQGKICYPSDFIPDGNILAKNIETNNIDFFPFIYEPGNQNFSISLKEGSYIFAYKTKDNNLKGYYSKCALTGHIDDCSTTESHQPIVVNVKSDTIIEDIILCDYYYGEEEPSF